MADLKKHMCFPTVVAEFQYKSSAQSKKEMLSYVKDRTGFQQTKDDLHTTSEFKDFANFIFEINQKHLTELGYIFDRLDMTGMWANTLQGGEIHQPHTHSNNFLSGVYYLKTSSRTSPIQFFDPRPQANVLNPKRKANWLNSSMIQFDSTENYGFIFPSWLQHWVPATPEKRISISCNILVRGEYGDKGTLQNSII